MSNYLNRLLRPISLLLAFAMLLSVGAFALEPATADATYKTGTFNYIHDAGQDLTDTHIYSDSWFTASADVENPQLRTVSLIAAMASANSESANSYFDKSKNIKTFLSNIGFEDIAVNAYYNVKPTESSAGCCIGRKTLTVSGDTYTLLAIIPRSEGYEKEWVSNFTVGESGLHQGFKEARDEVLRFAKKYVNDYNIEGKLKVWIAGHSRGAAIANLTAGYLVDFPTWLGDLAPQDIYAYTFGTPAGIPQNAPVNSSANPIASVAVIEEFFIGPATCGGGQVAGTKDTVINPKAEKYNCIHNYYSAGDFFTKVAPVEWDFTRYGVDTVLPETWASTEPLSMRYVAALDPLIFGSSTFGDPTVPFSAKKLSTEGGFALINDENSSLSASDFTQNRVSYLAAAPGSRAAYVTGGYQALLRQLFNTIYDDSFDMDALLAQIETDPEFTAELIEAVLSVYIYYLSCKAYALDLAVSTPGEEPSTENINALNTQLAIIALGIMFAPDSIKLMLSDMLGESDFSTALTNLLLAKLPGLFSSFCECESLDELLPLVANQVKIFFSKHLFQLSDQDASNAVRLLSSIAFGNSSNTLDLPITLDMTGLLSGMTPKEAITIKLDTPELNTAVTIFGNIAVLGREHINAALLSRMRAQDFCYIVPNLSTEHLSGPQNLELFTESGAEIYYTLDGSTPTAESTAYTEAIPLTDLGDYSIKAISILNGISSPVWTFNYTVANPVSVLHPSTPATTIPAASTEKGFVDVPETAYFNDAVDWAVENSITAGTTETTFSPALNCTRAQIVTFLWRAFACPENNSSESYLDVDTDAYYAKAVAWAVENGITAGTSDTTFSPDKTCTRAQAVTFLWRAAGRPDTGVSSPFADVDADAYYAKAVAWAVENGITVGTSDTTFSPDADCTRAQIITFLYRSMK